MKASLNHVMRATRLKLKSGFIRVEPEEYIFMKRYPPVHRDTAPKFHQTVVQNIPYLDLYHKAVRRNPLYEDETVYPAYWRQEPQALVLAKKQYEFIKNGLDEEAAYQKALSFIDVIENEALAELNSVLDSIKEMGAKAPFMSDKKIVDELFDWNEKLKGKSYEDLGLADQGDIDFFIQDKLMGWNEVQRERRMKDPVFVYSFKKLRNTLFPKDDEALTKEAAAREEIRERRAKLAADRIVSGAIDSDQPITLNPFIAEEYIRYFAMIKAQPDMRMWSSDNRSRLSQWIKETLTLKQLQYTMGTEEYYEYSKDVRNQFFPLLQYQDRAHQFETPTLDRIREVLYENNVGYTNNPAGMYVRRFYRLPMLLFPQETLASEKAAEQRKIAAKMSGSASIAAMKRKMSKSNASSSGSFDLDSLLSGESYSDSSSSAQSDDDSSISADHKEDIDDSGEMTDEQRREWEIEAFGHELTDENRESEAYLEELMDDFTARRAAEHVGRSKNTMSADEWKQLVGQYVKTPEHEYDWERESFLFQNKLPSVEDCEDETDLEQLRHIRNQTKLVEHARLGLEFERKETKRRARDWKRRGVWGKDQFPPRTLNAL